MKRCPQCGYREPKPVSHWRKKLGLQPAKKKGQGIRIGDRDEYAKIARGYVEPGSFVRKDGSERLLGKDWLVRKGELAERSEGRCEYIIHNTDGPILSFRCSRPATIPAHIIPRHPKRDDRMSNLKHYCRHHDQMTEKQSWRQPRFGEHKR